MLTKPFAQERPDGSFVLSLPATIMAVADIGFSNPEDSSDGAVKARAFIDDILQAAVAGGYKRADIAETLLARSQLDRRAIETAMEIAAHVNRKDCLAVFNRFGL